MITAARQLLSDIVPAQRQEILSRMEDDTAVRYHEALNPVKGFSIAAGRDLLRRLGASVLQKPLDSVRVQHEAGGKPYLEVFDSVSFVRSSYHVSISHSDGGLLSVMSKRNTACDVQGMRHFPLEAVRGFFSPEDLLLIENAADPHSVLIKLWCRRECLIKLFGTDFPVRKISLGNTMELLNLYGVTIYEAQWEYLYLAVMQMGCDCSVPNINIKWINI